MKSDRREIYQQLRREFPSFIYEGYSYGLRNNEMRIEFHFNASNRYHFRPQLSFQLPPDFRAEKISDSLLRNIIFNMGMVELISYWKAVCSPKVIIKAFSLSPEQLRWWKKLCRHGLGEFFYENGIVPGDDFMEIIAEGRESLAKSPFHGNDEILVPVGGGKDSVVTMELLSAGRPCRPFMINPLKASLRSVKIAGYSGDDPISLQRNIDPLLLELNDKGYLNGHTPFSAMLAFTSLLVAAVHGMGEIALSNESSANEPSIPGTKINHQYSKSLEFEVDFRHYVSYYITDGIEYYSFLRPLNELQIAGIFANYRQHFNSFRSCNVGSRSDSWCGKCPKCLFTYIILSPFIDPEKLKNIFGHDLLDDRELLPLLKQLTGIADEKPFECVGTVGEVNAALHDIAGKYPGNEKPALLKYYLSHTAGDTKKVSGIGKYLRAFEKHCIPDKETENMLKEVIHGL
jgi:hypothetical protein